MAYVACKNLIYQILAHKDTLINPLRSEGFRRNKNLLYLKESNLFKS